ncbi:hypothetical protein ACJX0J_013749, partial [Zea mays]
IPMIIVQNTCLLHLALKSFPTFPHHSNVILIFSKHLAYNTLDARAPRHCAIEFELASSCIA